MDIVRYVLAVVVVVALPPAVIMWLIVHPLAGFWRRLGPWPTYVFITAMFLGVGTLDFQWREVLLGRDLGTNWILAVVGLVPYVASIRISLHVRKHLTFSMLAGLPEVSPRQSPGRLLQEGIYGIVRHPRYLAVVLGSIGFALFVNYVGVYVMTVALIPTLYVVILLEERELLERLGPAYAEYRERVPMLIPGRGRGGTEDG